MQYKKSFLGKIIFCCLKAGLNKL